MARMIAGMTIQYGVKYTGLSYGGDHVEWIEPTGDNDVDVEMLHFAQRRWQNMGQPGTIVTRYVTGPTEVKE